MNLINHIGQILLNWVDETGRFLLFVWKMALCMVRPPFRFAQLFEQMRFIGAQSIFIIVLTGTFTGMVLALQSGKAFRLFNAETLTGAVAGLSLTRELGPVLSALMVTARCGSAMAAELGSMRVTQQVDALLSMSVNPMNYLVVPRVVATILVLPLLTAVFDFVGGIGTYLVGVELLQIDEGVFMAKLRWYVDLDDLIQGFFKAACFGCMLSLIGCYKGLSASGGAKGVGIATTSAVVIASVAILIGDYFLTALLF